MQEIYAKEEKKNVEKRRMQDNLHNEKNEDKYKIGSGAVPYEKDLSFPMYIW